MIPGVSSVLSSWRALSGRHLLLLARLGATVFWRVAVNKPPRVLRRSGYVAQAIENARPLADFGDIVVTR